MTGRPSRLWRVLGATAPVFQVNSLGHNTTWDDFGIHAVSLTSGTTMNGLSTGGGSVTLRGAVPRLTTATAQVVTLGLSTHGRALLAGKGVTVNDTTHRRFHGRAIGMAITDDEDGRQTSVMNLQDWGGLLTQLDAGAVVPHDQRSTADLLESLITRGAFGATVSRWGSSWHHVRIKPEDPDPIYLNTGDALRYLADAGVFVRFGRDGNCVAWSHDHLVTVAEDWATYWPETLLRAQVLSPAAWVQSSTTTTRLSYSKINSAGSQLNGAVTIGSPGYTVREQHLDLTHLVEQGDGLTDYIVARAASVAPGPYALESVTVDLLALLDRATTADIAVVSQLLNMSHGDVVVVAHDWPTYVVGAYFAQTITEEVTPDGWKFKIDLVPTQHVTGRPAPPVNGRTWNSAYPAVTTWETPTTATWNTVPQEA